MALADYSTAAEKIAALKAAMIDPALMNLETGDLNVSEDIYLATWSVELNSLTLMSCSSYSYIMPKLSSGDVLTSRGASYAFMYIKDSDIIYPDPVTTYQDRLARISESNMKVVDGNGFTAGSNGCLILTPSGATYLNINGKSVVYLKGDTIGRPVYTPIQNGWVVSNDYSGDETVYIDLPAGW